MRKSIILFCLFFLLSLIVQAQKLNPGDGVRITFLNITDQITGDYNIQQDGNIQLPFIGLVTNDKY